MLAAMRSPWGPLQEQAESILTYGQATLLALVQALTEFLPISSSGHLVITQDRLGIHSDSLLVEVALHLGTLVAVVWFYREAWIGILRDALGGRPRELLLVALGTLPVAIAGVLLKDAIETRFGNPTSAGMGLIGTAMILVWGERSRRASLRPPGAGGEGESSEEAPLRIRDVLLVGIGQAIAIMPGISRSGTTIAVGLWCGLPAHRAARLSFLLSIPAILGATVLTAKDLEPGALEGGILGPLLLGIALSAAVGYLALRFLLAFLDRGAFLGFAVYCALVGLVVSTLL